ncbi:Frigida-like protein [Thalictrum thalictroides]|uniref:FRIGIDA-like protein n=1 Tax=Thalictrum thalictroides TaxID=46969 RepID=A0A7J6X3H7_THATH|nr:Frigida-like protein [Thalictrum thalictroides]
MEKIEEALDSTKIKKENLRKAFDLVQLHSSCLSSFNLQWNDLEIHFDSLQSSLHQSFKQLQSLENKLHECQHNDVVEQQQEVSSFRIELKSFCLDMNGCSLRSYIMDRRKEITATRDDVVYALKFALDPAKLVLDALQGFYPLKSKRDRSGGELGAIRRTCVLLLEGLSIISPEIKDDVKEEAKKLAVDWKFKMNAESDGQLEALVFLQLLGTYGLASEFDEDELLELLVNISRRRQAVDLFRGLGFHDKLSGYIQTLSNKGKQIDAIKFTYAFEMVDKFPPVPLLKAYLNESKKVAQEVLKKGNNSLQSQNEAIAKETAYLKAMIKCIEEYKLESQYDRQSLDKRIEQLEKQKVERKRPIVTGPSPVFRSQQNQQMQLQNGNKRLHMEGSKIADSAMNTFAPSSQMHLQPTGLLREYVAPYLSSSSHYSLAGTTPTILPPYMSEAGGPSVGAASLNVNTNQSPSLPHLYSSESHLPSSIYDRSLAFGGYGLLPSYGSSHFYS